MKEKLEKILEQRIMVLDGAMGTMIQAYKFEEEDYRGERFKIRYFCVPQEFIVP